MRIGHGARSGGRPLGLFEDVAAQADFGLFDGVVRAMDRWSCSRTFASAISSEIPAGRVCTRFGPSPSATKAFMQAVKRNRVLTVVHNPTSKRKDYGEMGFHKRRFILVDVTRACLRLISFPTHSPPGPTPVPVVQC